MTDPGWIHAQGDPVNSVRYWDGQTWVGEPTLNPGAGGVIHYAAVTEVPIVPLTPRRQMEPQTQPKSAARAEAPLALAGARIPASAQLIAIGLCALKAIPLALMLLNALLVAVFGTIGLSLAYNQDVEDLLALAIGITLATVAVGAGLLIAQAMGATRGNPVLLLVPALLMTGWDGLLTVGSFAAGVGTERFFYAGIFLLQGWVLVGAIIGMTKPATATHTVARSAPVQHEAPG